MIRRCIESVLELDYPHDQIEIIYVDSGSTDRTLEIASKYPVRIVQLKSDEPNAALACNEGIKISKGMLVHILPADSAIDPKWLRNSLPYMDIKEVACVTGRRKELFPEASIYNKLVNMSWQNAPSGYVDVPGAGGLFKKAVLEEIGFYNGNLKAAEEVDIGYRIIRRGYKIINISSTMIYHDADILTLFEYLKRAMRNGYGTAQVFKKYWHSKDKPKRFYSSVIKADIQVALFIILLVVLMLHRFFISYILSFFVAFFILRKFIQGYLISRSIWTSFLFVFMSFLSRCAGFVGYVRCFTLRKLM